MSLLIPSYKAGFARCAAEAEYPGLWKGLVGLWAPYLGPTGLTLFDWAGRKNHGTLTNMDPATDWVMSPYGLVLDVDGANDYVESLAAVTSYPLTLAGRFCPRNITADQTIIAIADTDGTSYMGLRAMGSKAGDPVRATTSDNLGVAAHVDTAIGFAADTWQFAVAVFGSATDVRVYLNAANEGAGIGKTIVGLDNTCIGNLKFNGAEVTHPFNGLLGPVAAWSRALFLDEIEHLCRKPHILTTPPSLILPTGAAPPGVAPTSHLYGSLVGPLGGAV